MIKIREDKSAAELRKEASGEKIGTVCRRLLGIAHAIDGMHRKDAARLVGMEYQSLVDAINRYNADGLDGLKDKTHPGRPPIMTPEQDAELRKIVLAGPNGRDIGSTEFRVRHIADIIEEKWGLKLHQDTVREKLHALGLRNLVCRPVHYKADPEEQAAYKADFAAKVAKVAAAHPEAEKIEVWCQDETRVGQKSAVARRWAERGSSPTAVVQGGFKSAWLYGAFCAERDIGVSIVIESVSVEAMNAHLAEISKAVLPRNHALLQVDGAGWHETAKELVVPPNITLVTLPAYSPELNPPERVWQFLKGGPLAHRLYDSVDEIIDKVCCVWNRFVSEPGRIRSLCSYPWMISC
jgi:transposase